MNRNDMEEIQRSRNKGCLGCFFLFIILIVVPIIWGVWSFFYAITVKETLLVEGQSPNKTHSIQVMEVGEPFFFGPSSIRIKSGKESIETGISNDGKTLDEANIEIVWENDENAVITLMGEEQKPEVIRFHADQDDLISFTVEYVELGYIKARPRDDSYSNRTIEIRTLVTSKGADDHRFDAPVRVYYGEKNEELDMYEEWDIQDYSFGDYFEVYWNEKSVFIQVIAKNDNDTTYVKDSIDIKFE